MRETFNLEYKSDFTKSFLKTVSAFANYQSGQIIFGVDDSGKAMGVSNPQELALRIENAINDSIDPKPHFKIAINEADNTLILTVYAGPHKPYVYNGHAYQRSDSSTVAVDRIEFMRLVLMGQNVSFDELDSDIQQLSFDSFATHVHEAMEDALSLEGALVSFKLKKLDGTYNNAALLLSDENTFPGVELIRFGSDRNIIKSRKTLEHMSVLQMIDEALELFEMHYTYEVTTGARRTKQYLIPRDAFREALANAIGHRQWDIPASIIINMFDDYIEVVSPGGLPDSYSEEMYFNGGASFARNPILFGVLFRLNYVEHIGSGVPRIISMYEMSDVKPHVEFMKSALSLRLPRLKTFEFSWEEQQILNALTVDKQLSRADLQACTGLSAYIIRKALKDLESKHQVLTVGSGRSTAYRRVL